MLLGVRWGGLRTKIFAWTFVPTAMILAAVALVTFFNYQRVTEELVVQRDQDVARLSAGQLATELEEYTDLLTALARTTDVYTGDPGAQREALKRASNRLAVFDGGVVILDTFGTVVTAEPERPDAVGQDWSARACYGETLHSQMLGSGEPTFSNVVNDGPGGTEVVCIAVPITGEQGEFLGVMAGLFRLGATSVSAFYGDIVKLQIGESGDAYLVDRNGRVIYHSDTGRIGEDFSAQPMVQLVLDGQVDAIHTRDAGGSDIVASFAPVPGTPWGLVIEESWATLISSSQPYQRRLMVLLALGLVVPILIVTVGVRRVTRPVMELTSAVQEVAKGNFGQTITAHTGDEIEELAEQFNLMSAELQESYAHLEQRVADRTRELAALNAIAAVASHSLDLQEILDSALDKALEVIGLEAGGIYLLQPDEVLTVVAHKGLDAEFVAEIDNLKVGEGFSGRVVQTGEPLIVRHLSTDPRLTRSVVREAGFNAVATVPLVSRGKVLGSLFGITRADREFSQEDIELGMSIGHQIGVAIENVRLFKAQERRAEQFRVINEVGRHVASILDVDQLLDQMVRLIQQGFDYYLVEIGLVEGDHVAFKAGVGGDWGTQFKTFSLTMDERSLTGRVALTGEPLLVPDVSQEPHYVKVTDTATRSELILPLKTKSAVIGILNVESDQLNAFDESDLAALQSLAHQAAIAIENARLYEQAQQVAILEERQRLARELHDSVTQSLYGVTLYGEAAARLLQSGEVGLATDHLHKLRGTAQEALREMRLLIFELRPPILEQEGLVGALQARLEAVEGRAGLKTVFKAEGEERLPPEVEEGLYRIAHEALNNSLKHAQAKTITVSLCQDPQAVLLEITDDGIGFDVSTAGERGGLGLGGMKERAMQLGGHLTVESRPGAGTTVRVEAGR